MDKIKVKSMCMSYISLLHNSNSITFSHRIRRFCNLHLPSTTSCSMQFIHVTCSIQLLRRNGRNLDALPILRRLMCVQFNFCHRAPEPNPRIFDCTRWHSYCHSSRLTVLVTYPKNTVDNRQ